MANWDIWDYIFRPATNFFTLGLSELGWHQRDVARDKEAAEEQRVKDILSGANSENALDIQGQLANSGLSLTPDQEKFLDNLISQYNTNSARDWEKIMSDTALLRNADQLRQLGLSNAGVLDVGGAASNGVGTADNVKTNMSQERYNQRMQNARSMISLVSSLASAGIHGASFYAARKAASALSDSAAHSATRLVTRYDGNDRRIGRTISEELPADFDWSRLF